MKELKTWAGKSNFSYTGSLIEGTSITYGQGITQYVSVIQYSQLLNHFRGRTVNIGTSRTDPPSVSVGKWLNENVTKVAIASYGWSDINCRGIC